MLQGYQRMTKEAITAISKAGLTANPWAYSLCQLNQDVEMDDPPSATAESTRNWRQLQRDDPIVGYLHQKVCSKQRPKKKRAPRDTETQTLLREWDRLKIIRGVLYRVVIYKDQERKQLVLPEDFRQQALEGLHDDVGQLGRDMITELAKDRFYWPGMTTDIERLVKECVRCILRKSPTSTRAQLVNEMNQALGHLCANIG